MVDPIPPRDDDDEEILDEPLRRRLEGYVPEAVKKLALAGVGALFLTEEGIRSVLSEMKLPREAVSGVLSQTEKARSELFRMIAEEFRRFLEHANISGELSKVLTNVTVDVNATIAFRRNEEGKLETDVKSDVKRRRGGDEGGDE
ncbi:MAG: hypothetical protein P1V51_10370 [Deltaproteobacteria bacterium]|nr:hypothetical protein [Deltaproteobacteria bacterium]